MTQNRIHIIAEAGNNHNACPETGKKLIDVAKEAGADSVKFQMIYPEGLYVSKLQKEDGTFEDNPVIEIRRSGMLADDDYRMLSKYCQTTDLPMSSSIFDQKGLDLLSELDPPYIKIASCDLNNSPLLKAAASTGKKLIISTGMSTIEEVKQAVADIESTGNRDLVIMHCVSVYPCPTDNMNLSFIKQLLDTFDYPIGLSDHSESSLAAAAAVALGVTWIEKHFTLDRTSEGYDHPYAMEPDMLTQYISDIRDVEAAMTPKSEKLCDKESFVSERARRGLYAARDIGPGETITENDVLIVRPTAPMAPNEIGCVVGSTANTQIKHFQPLSNEMFTTQETRKAS